MNAPEEFRSFAAQHGYELPANIEPGRKIRFSTNGKRGDEAGWAFLFPDCLGGVVGDWRSGEGKPVLVWQAERAKSFSADERRAFMERVERQRREAQEQRERDANEAAARAQEIWASSRPAREHAYLTTKGIPAYGLKVYAGDLAIGGMDCEGALILPLRNVAGEIRSLEFINDEGQKRFLPDGDYRASFFSLGGAKARIAVCEGFATGGSIYKATGTPVRVAATAGNLVTVAKALRDAHPDAEILICADNDHRTVCKRHKAEGITEPLSPFASRPEWCRCNPGITSGLEAAKAVGGTLAFPDTTGTDFNDLAKEHGDEAVKQQIEAAKPIQQQEQGEQMHEHDEEGGWPEPRPLQRKPSEPTPFPVDALGEILGEAARAATNVIQAPLAISGNSFLAGAALAAQGHANLLIDGRRSPLSEFFVTIGQSGERKSAVDAVALWPHRERQRQLREAYERDHAEYKRKADAFKKSKEEAIGSAKSKTYDDKCKELAKLGDEPKEPLAPFLICEEPTLEGLQKMLAHGQPSIGLFSDEGGRFIGGHGMNSENLLKTAAGMSGFWDGKEVSRVRAGDGVIVLPGRRVSFHLMAQPDIAAMMLSNAVLIEQGLLSRCLVTWPTSTAGTRFYKEIDLTSDEAVRLYSGRMLRLLEQGYTLREGTRNELAPRDLPLDEEAKQIWIQFHDSIEKEISDGGQLAAIRGLANKAPEHAARVAGILAVVDDIACPSISARWLKSGIKLVNHYLNEALRLFEAGATDPDIREAEKLWSWLQSRPKEKRTVVTLVEVYQLGPNGIRNAKRARFLMQLLEDHGYVRPTLDPENRRKEAWSVRP
jgi:phage/plasmid primase-like uncharacterized protein